MDKRESAQSLNPVQLLTEYFRHKEISPDFGVHVGVNARRFVEQAYFTIRLVEERSERFPSHGVLLASGYMVLLARISIVQAVIVRFSCDTQIFLMRYALSPLRQVLLMTERKLLDDQTFPSGWPKVGDHEGHEIRKKEGVSKELGVHGVAVGVDFDICIADGICISVCPVNVFDKMDFPGEQDKIDKQLPNDSGKPLLDRWKADPIRERDCIFCRACEIQCPVQAIKITEGVGPFA